MLKSLYRWALSLVFPPECEICGRGLPSADASGVCGGCESEIRWIAPPHCAGCGRTLKAAPRLCGECANASFHFDRAYACAFYEGKMKELLHRYKFGRRKTLGHFFVKKTAQFLDTHLGAERFDAVLAVPLDKDRRRERGFNQAGFIASRLAKRMGLPDRSNELGRKKSRLPQSRLTKTGRALNVRGRFRVRRENAFSGGGRLLLLDDILTSGQTASECARVLKEAGAGAVTVLACARGR